MLVKVSISPVKLDQKEAVAESKFWKAANHPKTVWGGFNTDNLRLHHLEWCEYFWELKSLDISNQLLVFSSLLSNYSSFRKSYIFIKKPVNMRIERSAQL